MENVKKIEVWMRLGQLMTKNLFAQTIPEKIFRKKQRNVVKLDRTRKLWY